MQYRVPQFIEHEAKILGPLNIKQSITIGGVGVLCFFLYFFIGDEYFFLFILIASFLIGIALAISFYKVEGRELPVVMKNWAFYISNPRLYLWKRKESPVFLSTERQKEIVKEEKEKSPFKNEGRWEDRRLT